MAYIDQYSGMLQEIYAERGQLALAESTTAISSGVATTRILINAYAGPFLPRGSSLLIKPRYTNNILSVKLSADLDTGDTAIDFDSFTPSFDIPAKTSLFFNNANAEKVVYANMDFIIKNSEVGKKIITYFSKKNQTLIMFG